MRDYEAGAAYLGVPVRQLRTLVARKAIGFNRIGGRYVRFSQSDLDAYLRSTHVEPAEPYPLLSGLAKVAPLRRTTARK